MPNPVAAIEGGSAALSFVQSERASSRADRASRREHQFNERMYNDWKAIYGPIEQNLSEYYQNLTPEGVTAQGLENIEKEFSNVKTQIEEQLIQRGLGESGIETATDQNLVIQKALARAKTRQEAPQVVAEAKQRFLQGGEQRRANAAQGLSQSYQGQTNRATEEANMAADAFGSFLNLGLQNLPGLNTPSTASESTRRD